VAQCTFESVKNIRILLTVHCCFLQKRVYAIQVNVLALCICTKEAIRLMRELGIDDGHIIHINRWDRVSIVTCIVCMTIDVTQKFSSDCSMIIIISFKHDLWWVHENQGARGHGLLALNLKWRIIWDFYLMYNSVTWMYLIMLQWLYTYCYFFFLLCFTCTCVRFYGKCLKVTLKISICHFKNSNGSFSHLFLWNIFQVGLDLHVDPSSVLRSSR